jgi:hypothetical protein
MKSRTVPGQGEREIRPAMPVGGAGADAGEGAGRDRFGKVGGRAQTPRGDRLLDQAAQPRLVHRRHRAADGRDLVRVGIDGDDLVALGGEAARRNRAQIIETEDAELHNSAPAPLTAPRRQTIVAPDHPARAPWRFCRYGGPLDFP